MSLALETSPEIAISSLAHLVEAVCEPHLSPPPRALEIAKPQLMFTPQVPSKVEQTGIAPSIIEQLLVKHLHFAGEMMGRELARAMGVKFSIIEPLIDAMRKQRMIEVKGSLGYGAVSSVYQLAEAGRLRARDALDTNQYCGPVPVPIEQYSPAVRAQRLRNGWLSRDMLINALKHMVVTDTLVNQVGPAINSGKSFLVYGRPGNGKTYLAEALFNLDSAPVFVPHAIECGGAIIRLFDPVYHAPIEEATEAESSVLSCASEPAFDPRWAKCRRPFIVTGGELALDMLDLTYNPSSKVYDAPFQLKANNGIYLIDDFGRQRATPAEVLNRWIVPMDRKVDYLNFQSGGKMEVPFETFLIFSTNLKPEGLGDEAFLRRLQYKMFVGNPDEEEYRSIFSRFCAQNGLECDSALIEWFLERNYRKTARPRRRCQPRDVISHAIDLISFEGRPYELTADLLDRAWASCFLDTSAGDE